MHRTNRSRRTAGHVAAVLAASLMAFVALPAAPAGAGAPPAACTPPLDGAGGKAAALTWLSCELQLNGDAMPSSFGGTDYGLTIDAILALSLGGRPAETDAAVANLKANIRSYVTDQDFGDGDERYAGALGKALVVAGIHGDDATAFGSIDLEAEVRGRMDTSGADAGRFSDLSSFGNYSNGFGQTLSIMGLSYTDAGVPSQAIAFLLDQQCPGGGFRLSYDAPGGCTGAGETDTDATSFAVQALLSVPQLPRVTAAIDLATDWLVGQQQPSGAFGGTGPTAAVNTNATGLAAQALRAAGFTAEADQAASWVAGRQLTAANAGTNGGADDVGAIALDPAGLASAQATGIGATDRDQFRRSTAQAALVFDARTFGLLSGSVFVPLAPCRVLDTRLAGGPYVPGQVRTVSVSGSCSIPATATAVDASISAVTPSGTGFLRAWPAGEKAPNATQLNYSGGQGTTNTGAIALGSGGALSTAVFSNRTQVVIDVQGYFVRSSEIVAPAKGSVYVAVAPCRVADSRGHGGALASQEQVDLSVAGTGTAFAQQGGKDGGCGVPADATAVQASVSAVAPSTSGFLRAWPAGTAMPNATLVNYARARGTTNTAAVALGADGRLTTRNAGGPTDLVVDVQGYFIDPASVPSGASGSTFVPAPPCRVLDTRSAAGAYASGERRSITVGGSCQVPVGATAIEAAISAVTPKGPGFVRAWPTGTTMPTATSLNYSRSQGTTNTGAIQLSGAGSLETGNAGGPTDLVIDVQGFYVMSPA